MLKMSHNDRPAFSLAYLFSQEFVCEALCCSFFFSCAFYFQTASTAGPQLGAWLVSCLPPCSDSHPVIVQPSSPPCELWSFAWLTQTSFGMLFSDMDFVGAALLAGKCNSAHPIVLGVSLFLFLSVLFFTP